MYRVLIVDDEPHVIDALTDLIESRGARPVDLYAARSGPEAISLMRRGRIDLLISDIQMPDMSGLTLLDTVNRFWPMCRTIFLTAHPNFSYAYEAIRKRVVSYILKTEEDSFILAEIERALRLLDEAFGADQPAARAVPPPDARLRALLERAEAPEARHQRLRALGFDSGARGLLLLAGLSREGAFPAITERLLRHMAGALTCLRGVSDEGGRMMWLMQVTDEASEGSRLLGLLETTQAACAAGASLPISFLIGRPEAYAALRARLQTCEGAGDAFVLDLRDERSDCLTRGTIEFIREYVEAHVGEDVSLLQLSSVTGYNAAYLSALFHRQTGERFNRYVARKKLERVESLLRDASLSIEEVARLSGFQSRPYFNRFIKSYTGMTPKAYRLRALSGRIE